MSMIENLTVDLKIVIGTANVSLSQFLNLGRGGVIMLENGTDKSKIFADHDDPINTPLKVLANGYDIARANVVLRGEDIAVEIVGR